MATLAFANTSWDSACSRVARGFVGEEEEEFGGVNRTSFVAVSRNFVSSWADRVRMATLLASAVCSYEAIRYNLRVKSKQRQTN